MLEYLKDAIVMVPIVVALSTLILFVIAFFFIRFFSKWYLEVPNDRECFKEYYNLLQKIKFAPSTTELAILEDEIIAFFERFKGVEDCKEYTAEIYAAHNNKFNELDPKRYNFSTVSPLKSVPG